MGQAKKLPTGKLANVIANALREYEDALIDDVNEAAKETGKIVRKEITQNAKELFPPNGSYANSWRVSKGKVRNRNDETYIVHSDDYRIAHLLEKGHAKTGGGRVEGRPHIKPAEDNGKEIFRQLLHEKIGGGGNNT